MVGEYKLLFESAPGSFVLVLIYRVKADDFLFPFLGKNICYELNLTFRYLTLICFFAVNILKINYANMHFLTRSCYPLFFSPLMKDYNHVVKIIIIFFPSKGLPIRCSPFCIFIFICWFYVVYLFFFWVVFTGWS